MAHNLTESAIFEAAVQVPDDGDNAVAASVVAAFQALANRTTFYKGERDSGMSLGASLLTSIAQALTARITAATVANATSAFTLLGSFGSVRLYIGASDGIPGFVLVSNAVFGVASTWTKITNNQPATALFVRRDRFVVASMPADQNTAWANAFVEGEGTTSGWGRLVDVPADGETDTVALADIARVAQRITNVAGVERVLLFEWTHATLAPVRIYFVLSGADAPGFEVVLNAKYNNNTNNWTRDIAGDSIRQVINLDGFQLHLINGSAGATFLDGGWTTNLAYRLLLPGALADRTTVEMRNGRIQFIGVGTGNNDSNPGAQASIPNNTLLAKNIPKIWAYIETDATPLILDGLGLASSNPITYSGNNVVLAFDSAMGNANYECNVTVEAASGTCRVATIVSKALGSVTVAVYEIGSGTFTHVNLSTATVRLNISIKGVQN